ncbi:uncharacterized protein BDZ99DRAFT_401210 [Mytilinidion resinicola]|uniref:ubiquitinyl hydrolase 1 n=1 Tax=Mytilinidion resinicola TaxID=574789 RepID=A0A6A6Y319_9PEZI|nr:uncharacterized protein BDZ99DRAFT_401210 [Mytilinidion resinicola]KAF2802615.1 hypothetical protein BDZ99DRAFT_401210 [Mytilinidion resinicola]
MAYNRIDLASIVHHVFLPPKLPPEAERYPANSELLRKFLRSLDNYHESVQLQERSAWASCVRMIQVLLDLQYSGRTFNAKSLILKLTSLNSLALHLREQNAAALIKKNQDETTFSFFELSPSTERVMACKTRLRRSFPEASDSIANAVVADPAFHEPFAEMMVDLDEKVPPQAEPKTRKANQEVREIRQSVNPFLATNHLPGILRAIGKAAPINRIVKHTRDDVPWKNAASPWRRSPLWLLLRVAIQLTLAQSDLKKSTYHYKSFMLFFMNDVLGSAIKESLPTETLFIMKTKISRRVLKMGQPISNSLQAGIHSAQNILESRWNSLQRDRDLHKIWTPWTSSNWKPLTHEQTTLSLPSLKPYVESRSLRQQQPSIGKDSKPRSIPRVCQSKNQFPDITKFSTFGLYDKDNKNVVLADVEEWVRTFLLLWVQENMSLRKSTRNIADLLKIYCEEALSAYHDDPVMISTMFLTAMELWIALDMCALEQRPVLSKYAPGFPPALLEPLLLPSKHQMERLCSVERYLSQRDGTDGKSSPVHFLDVGPRSLAVQVYDTSTKHQELYDAIVKAAEIARDKKLVQLDTQLAKHEAVSSQLASATCSKELVSNQENHDQMSCTKCSLDKEIKTLSRIAVHEWPLPADEVQAKLVVFELMVPDEIEQWRSTTYWLQTEVFARPTVVAEIPEELFYLHDFEGLAGRGNINKEQRLQLASTAKAFVFAHYKDVEIQYANKSSVFVNHAMKYGIFDSIRSKLPIMAVERCDIRSRCAFQISEGLYSTLSDTLESTLHTVNEVLSRQSQCSASLNTDEFYAFGALRAGHRIQWLNIANELVSQVLSFGRQEVCDLVLQACWQAGPAEVGNSNLILRESHQVLQGGHVSIEILSGLEDCFSNIEKNWEGTTAARLFAALAARLLSLNTRPEIQTQCFAFLRRVRNALLIWMRKICEKVQGSQTEAERTDLRERLLEAALVAHSTFQVDEYHVEKLLTSQEDVAHYLAIIISIRENYPAAESDIPCPLRLLLQESSRLCHRLETVVRRLVLDDHSSLDLAIGSVWDNYPAGGVWKSVDALNERWLSRKILPGAACVSRDVYFNVLTGEVLVNGRPISRLPSNFESHATFKRLFQGRILYVSPSGMDGMDFKIRSLVHGQHIHLGMHDSELIVRAYQDDGRAHPNDGSYLELVPIDALGRDVPKTFVDEYVHWLHSNSLVLQFRPLLSPWIPPRQPWQIRLNREDAVNHQDLYRLRKGYMALMESTGLTGRAITSLLSPLENEEHIHIMIHETTSAISVQLPRLNLDFVLGVDLLSLESKQFRGMRVDPNQAVGTMTGLKNKLVLSTLDNAERCMVVPFGTVRFAKNGDHVHVTIDTGAEPQVPYYVYQVDEVLGRLTGDNSLKSNLYMIYLHAVTSYCLPDNLTGKTGTETALDGIRSASVRSHGTLSPDDLSLLSSIAHLTPQRTWYPKGRKTMQCTNWANLPSLSQHSGFYGEVQKVIRHYRKFDVFREHIPSSPASEAPLVEELLQRAIIRDSVWRLDGYGAEFYTTQFDEEYVDRDGNFDTQRELRAYSAAKLASSWEIEQNSNFDLWSIIQKNFHHPVDQETQVKLIDRLGYDPTWLKPASEFLPDLYRSFDLCKGFEPTVELIEPIAERHSLSRDRCLESKIKPLPNETKKQVKKRRQDQFKANVSIQARSFAELVVGQFNQAFNKDSALDVPHDGNAIRTYINVEAAVVETKQLFMQHTQNVKFRRYIENATRITSQTLPVAIKHEERKPRSNGVENTPQSGFIKLSKLFQMRAPSIEESPTVVDFRKWLRDQPLKGKDNVEALLQRLDMGEKDVIEQSYVQDLRKSLKALKDSKPLPGLSLSLDGLHDAIEAHVKLCEQRSNAIYVQICDALRDAIEESHAFDVLGELTPRTSPLSLLHNLTFQKLASVSVQWKITLVQYGVALSDLQRARRLRTAFKYRQGNPVALLKELTNAGHDNWDPVKNPDWLLLELENNIIIRSEQVQTGHAMIDPEDLKNTILQLNMGAGKSSVIVPIVAAALANGRRLTRVVVLKQLAPEMHRTLIAKCSGMLNRPIYLMPFSRSLKISKKQADGILALYEECMAAGGILLTQPEHILSARLMGYEKIVSERSEKKNAAQKLIRMQHWLSQHARDILDESDELLSPVFELVYTIGGEQLIDWSPERWCFIQKVLGRLSVLAAETKSIHPEGIRMENKHNPGSFPHIQVLLTDASEMILKNLANEFCTEWSKDFALPDDTRKELYLFLTTFIIQEKDVANLHEMREKRKIGDHVWNTMLILRGLIAGGTMKFAFQDKRWRVHYGLDLTRSRLAVPFRAKDVPSSRAEYSHPDLAIVLTCLCYYYKGFSNDELTKTLRHLKRSDNSQHTYEGWLAKAKDMPSSFRNIQSVNLQDTAVCDGEVFPHLRFTKAVIDYYLANLVFSAQMREFPFKLSASGWDIAQVRTNPTTGFSGTKDSKHTLPSTIKQAELDAQLHTNATVLNDLLGAKNTYQDIPHNQDQSLNADVLLTMVIGQSPPVRVILDVGAQVLDLRNQDVAQLWLDKTTNEDAKAVIFVTEQDSIAVLDRAGTLEALAVSPWLRQMDQCFVYLDQAHTRGTDLKLPINYRAAVTLGPLLTKDRLVQACMRMRNLGKGQSVVACASKEIEKQIKNSCNKELDDKITMLDVVEWCIRNTCIQIRKELPMWAQQGERYTLQQNKLNMAPAGVTSTLAKSVVEELKEREAQTLDMRYGINSPSLHQALRFHLPQDNAQQSHVLSKDTEAIASRCQEFNINPYEGPALQEEHERELCPENEREQQVERPRPMKPFLHVTHVAIKAFAQTGQWGDLKSEAVLPAFRTLKATSAGKYLQPNEWPQDLLVSRDFAQTVQNPGGQVVDAYLKPVNWVLSRQTDNGTSLKQWEVVIISPAEANELLPIIMEHKIVTLHVYSPRTRQSMRSLDNLSFCVIPQVEVKAVPSLLVTQLNLFAGQLYQNDDEANKILCEFLGLWHGDLLAESDGFMKKNYRHTLGIDGSCPFTVSPRNFVKEWLSVRRKGHSYERTHMGALVVLGRALTGSDFES